MNGQIIDKKLIYYIVNHYIDMRQLLRKLNIEVKPNNSMFCPFHSNENTPAAHLYKEEDNSYCIWCYAEDRMYSNVDIYKNYLPEINIEDLANLLYSRLPEEEKTKIANNINQQYELPELPYNNLLVDFKNNKISYKDLLRGINYTIPQTDQMRLLQMLYSFGESKINVVKNKYMYYMKNFDSNYRYLPVSKLIVNCWASIPNYLKDYLSTAGDSIMLPTIINDVVYSLTFRNINGQKRFIKVGQAAHLFYNMGSLPEDFKYGMPLILVEGNLDCDAIKLIYPYSIATLTNSLSLNQLQLLLHLTNKVIIAYDNDEAGNKGYWSTYNTLKKYRFVVKRFQHSPRLKDFGDLIDLRMKDKEEFDYLTSLYSIQIKNLLADM